jgi:hypothetical protein
MDPQPLDTQNCKEQIVEKEKGKRYKRSQFFVNPAVQGTYIAFSIVPAVLATLFCTYVLIHGGENVLRAASESPLVPVYTMKLTVESLESEGYTEKTAPKVKRLKRDLTTLKHAMENTYYETVNCWNAIRWQIYAIMVWCLILVGALALLFSHRIAGPLFRIRKCIDLFAEGKDSGPVHLRKRDQYKDLAESLETLRNTLVKKGVLQKAGE